MRHPPVVVSAGARARRCPEAGWLRLGRPPRRGRLPGRSPCRAAAGSIGSDRFRQRISLSQVAADSPLCPGGHGRGHWRKEQGMCVCQLRPLPWPLLARWPTELANVAAEDRPQIAGRPRPRACGVGGGGGGARNTRRRAAVWGAHEKPPASAVRSTPDCRGQTRKGPTDGEPTDTPRSTTLVRDCENRASVAMADQRPQRRGLCRGRGGGRRVVCAPVGVLRGQNATPRTTRRDPGPPCGAPPSGRSPAARPVKGACLRSSDFVPP